MKTALEYAKEYHWDINDGYDFNIDDEKLSLIIQQAMDEATKQGFSKGAEWMRSKAVHLLRTAQVGQTFSQHNFADAIRCLPLTEYEVK